MTGADGGARAIPRAGRGGDELRPVHLERDAAPFAEGSCLISWGLTRVLCTASVEQGVPPWRKGSGQGWLTAEYAMLPRATHTRTPRERAQLGGRTQEIQRLIGRSLRAMFDDFAFGEITVRVDCDVLQADGGTRVASITGACVAVADAFDRLRRDGRIPESPVRRLVAAVSGGVVAGALRLDLDDSEDVRAEVDMNVVMTTEGRVVEVQGTGEHGTFDRAALDSLVGAATTAITRLHQIQRDALGS
ncbi:MAG: ribonuclease PH [Gemmatimonadaceae bacterium]